MSFSDRLKAFNSISAKASLAASLVLVLFAMALGWVSYRMYYTTCVYNYSKASWSMAKTISLSVNGDLFEQEAISNSFDKVWPNKKNLFDRMLKKGNVKFAYIIIPGKDPETYRLYAAGGSPASKGIPVSRNAFSPELWRTMDERVDTLTDIYTGKGDALTTGETGEVIASFVPVFNSSEERIGAVGVGIDAKRCRVNLARFRNNVTLAAALMTLFLASIVSYAINRWLGNPIRAISEASIRLAHGDTIIPELPASNDEIGILSRNMQAAASSINVLTYGIDSNSDGGHDVPVELTGKYDMIAQGIRKVFTIMDHMENLVYVTDLDFNVIFSNKITSEVTGHTSKNKKCWMIMGETRDGPCSFCPLPDLISHKEKFPVFERETHINDSKEWYLIRHSIIRWIDGTLVQFCLGKDITSHKLFEEQQKNQERELRAAVLAAKEASRAKTNFLANMSHEIRTPMNGILGFSELAMSDEAVTEKTRSHLSKIRTSAESLLEILNNILDISKIETGMMELEAIPFTLHEVFELCKTVSEHKAEEKGILLHFQCDSVCDRVLIGDPTKLRQILLNLVSNAIKFTDKGAVTVKCSLLHELSGSVKIGFTVRDTGIGMNTEQVARVFEPFTQADSSITRKYGGTGLGLAIVNDYVKLLNGKLEVNSQEGIGTKFKFTIEFECDSDTQITADADIVSQWDESRPPTFSGNILICEDNKINQELIYENMLRVGLNVVIANNGAEGVERVRERLEDRQFDLIFMDIHMPVMGGLEAADIIREMKVQTPIIALTANVMAHDRERYLRQGLRECLGKPFQTHELWGCLHRYLPLIAPGGKRGDSNSRTSARLMKQGLGAVDRIVGLRQAAGNNELYRRLLNNFSKDNNTFINDLSAILSAGDFEGARRKVHTLKGTAGMIGAIRLSKAAQDIELGMIGGKAEYTDYQMEELEAALNEAMSELSEEVTRNVEVPLLESIEPIAIDKTERKRIVSLLDKMLPLLEAGDTGVLELLDEVQKELELLGENGEALFRQIDAYDFELAVKTALELRKKLEN